MSDKREKLMDAAENRVRASGYDGFSFRELAEAVGIKSSSVHYYFPTKADLGAAVARRYTDRFFESLPPKPHNPAKVLHEAFTRTIQRDKRVCLCGVLGSVASSLPTSVSLESKRFFGLAIKYLLGGEKRQTVNLREREWAFQVMASLEGGMILALSLGDIAAFKSLGKSFAAKSRD